MFRFVTESITSSADRLNFGQQYSRNGTVTRVWHFVHHFESAHYTKFKFEK